MYATNLSARIIPLLLLGAAVCTNAQEIRQGQGGTTYTMKEMKAWAQDLFAHRRYYAKGDMQASLGANNRYSPGDGARIQQQADTFRTNATTRANDHYSSASLAVSASGVVIKGSGGEPHQQGKYLRDCGFVSACYRALGDSPSASAYAAPVIAELLAHAREPLLDFAGRSVPGRSGYRWPVQQSDYLSSGSNPGFALAEWCGRLFVGYDYVRPLMTATDRALMDAWFLSAARWVALQVDTEQDKYYGNGSTDRRSGDQPWFERFADASAALVTRTDYGNQLPIYAGGPLCGGFKRYAYTNRHLTLSSFAYLIGLDRGDEALIKTGEFYFKETLCFGVFPTGDHVDLSRTFSDETPTYAYPGESEKGFNYFMSVVGRLVLMAEWSTRSGRSLASYGTTKGAFGTSNGSTRKDLLLMCRRAVSFFDSAANPRKYAAVTATSDPALLIDGINPAVSPGEVVSDTWLAGINIAFKDQGLRAAYQRTASSTRPYPEWPLGVGPNQPWSAHSEAVPGTLFMYAGREGVEASDYSLTSRIQGLRVAGVGGSTVSLAWTDPSTSDDRCTAIEIERATAPAGPFTLIARLTGGNPLTASAYTATGLTPATAYWFRLRGASVVGWSGYTAVVQATTAAGSPPPTPTLPGGWSSAAIGTATPGSASESAGTWTVTGSGTDIWSFSDGFRFAWMQVTGDVRITARVTALGNTDPWAKAGVMIRESTATGSRHAFTCITPAHGINFQERTASDGDSINTVGTAAGTPYWVRLERIGNTLIGSSSSDGVTWNEIHRDTVGMSAAVLVGLAVTSHVDGTACTATFTNVQITQTGLSGTGLPSGWSSTAIGTATPGSASESGGTWTVAGSGSDIWNASDGFRFVAQPVTGDVRIVARVTAVSNTDAWAKAGVMIRESNAAGASHAFTCLTPANGVAFQRRLSAGATSIHTAGPQVPAPYWVRLERIGDVLIGSCSPDGATWTEIRRETVTLPATALVGLAVTSHADGVLCTATFTNVQITAAPAAAN
jgi:regulation of enolase protein 1 (concanavalin A-like superfamily)